MLQICNNPVFLKALCSVMYSSINKLKLRQTNKKNKNNYLNHIPIFKFSDQLFLPDPKQEVDLRTF